MDASSPARVSAHGLRPWQARMRGCDTLPSSRWEDIALVIYSVVDRFSKLITKVYWHNALLRDIRVGISVRKTVIEFCVTW